MERKKEINLVLSGGSARGLAHIGVLAVLEKHFRIKSIIGTSMGAIVGGLYAYGYSPEEMLELPESMNMIKHVKTLPDSMNLIKFVKTLPEYLRDMIKLLSLFKPSFKTSGLSDGKGMLKILTDKTEDADIEQCKIPFAAVAFDLLSKKSVIIDKGKLAHAMRASSSLPFVFQPFQWGKYLFVDGYIEHPLPIKFANYYFEKGLTVACSVLPPFPTQFEVFSPGEHGADIEIPGMLDVFFQTNFYSQSSTVLDALLDSKPDLYISAFNDDLAFWELQETEKFFSVGKEATEKALEEYFSDKDHSSHRKFFKDLEESHTNFRKKVIQNRD